MPLGETPLQLHLQRVVDATCRGSRSDPAGCRSTAGYGRSACATDGAQPVICSTQPAIRQRHAVEAGHAGLELVVQLAAQRQVLRVDGVQRIDARRQPPSGAADVGQRSATKLLPSSRSTVTFHWCEYGRLLRVDRPVEDALAVLVVRRG